MRFVIPHSEFKKAFGLEDRTQFDNFNEKLEKEFALKLHSSATVESLDFMSTWKDLGGNTHTTLKGSVRAFGDIQEIGGEFVWLKNLRCFRGRLWSSNKIPSDLQLLTLARESYRKSEFHKAEEFLNAIQQIENVPRSAIKLRSLINNRIKNKGCN